MYFISNDPRKGKMSIGAIEDFHAANAAGFGDISTWELDEDNEALALLFLYASDGGVSSADAITRLNSWAGDLLPHGAIIGTDEQAKVCLNVVPRYMNSQEHMAKVEDLLQEVRDCAQYELPVKALA